MGEACASITTPIVGRTPDNVGREAMSNAPGPQGDPLRKIKARHRKLVLDINRCAAALLACNSYDQLQTESLTYSAPFMSKTSFLCAEKNVVDKDLSMELSESATECFKRCHELYVSCERRFCHNPIPNDDLPADESIPDCETDIEPSDSVSQVTSRYTVNTIRSSVVRRIKLERKRAELLNAEEMAEARKTKQLAEAEARRVQAEAEADARKTCLLAEAEEAEALAKLRLETAKLAAEEKLITCSERGSIATMSRASKIKSSFRPRAFVVNQKNVKHEENHAPVSLALFKQMEFSSTKRHCVVDRPARWDLNNSKSGLVHAHNSGLGRNLFNYHDRGARNVAVMPDVGVSGDDNDK